MTTRLKMTAWLTSVDGVALLQRIVLALNAFVSLILVATIFEPSFVGVYYAFLSILALQILFEQGMSQSLLTVASAAFQRSETTASSHQDLVRFAFTWYLKRVGAFASVSLLLGFMYFDFIAKDLEPSAWRGPWYSAVAATSLNLLMLPSIVLREAQGHRRDAWTCRLLMEVFALIAFSVAILISLSLWCVGLAALAKVFVSLAWLHHRRDYSKQLHLMYKQGAHNLDQIEQSFRTFRNSMSMSWLAGYVSHHSGAIFLLASFGPTVAGAYGLTSQLCNGVMSFVGIPILTRTQVFAANSTSGKFNINVTLFNKYLPKILILCITLVAGILSFWVFFNEYGLLQHKLLNFHQTAMMTICAACTSNNCSFSAN